jgi:hypothetical protein
MRISLYVPVLYQSIGAGRFSPNPIKDREISTRDASRDHCWAVIARLSMFLANFIIPGKGEGFKVGIDSRKAQLRCCENY